MRLSQAWVDLIGCTNIVYDDKFPNIEPVAWFEQWWLANWERVNEGRIASRNNLAGCPYVLARGKTNTNLTVAKILQLPPGLALLRIAVGSECKLGKYVVSFLDLDGKVCRVFIDHSTDYDYEHTQMMEWLAWWDEIVAIREPPDNSTLN